jgi:hypothetical protein
VNSSCPSTRSRTHARVENPRIEEYDVVAPDGTLVHVKRNIETGESRVDEGDAPTPARPPTQSARAEKGGDAHDRSDEPGDAEPTSCSSAPSPRRKTPPSRGGSTRHGRSCRAASRALRPDALPPDQAAAVSTATVETGPRRDGRAEGPQPGRAPLLHRRRRRAHRRRGALVRAARSRPSRSSRSSPSPCPPGACTRSPSADEPGDDPRVRTAGLGVDDERAAAPSPGFTRQLRRRVAQTCSTPTRATTSSTKARSA